MYLDLRGFLSLLTQSSVTKTQSLLASPGPSIPLSSATAVTTYTSSMRENGCICLDSDMTFRVKVVEDQSFDERLSQFGKGLPSSGCEKVRLRLFGLRRFLNFCPNLIVSNLIAINPPSVVQLTSTSSSYTTTNPDSALTGSCLRLSTP